MAVFHVAVDNPMNIDVDSKTMHLPWIVLFFFLFFFYASMGTLVWIRLQFDNINMFYFASLHNSFLHKISRRIHLNRNDILSRGIFY